MTLGPLLLAALASGALSAPAFAQQSETQPSQWSAQVVRQAEQALARMYYAHGRIDGRMDAGTRYGLRQFQRDQSLAATGSLNMETLAALGIEQDQYGARNEAGRHTSWEAASSDQQGFSRSVVRRAERALAQKQFVTGPIDGVLDPQTRYGLHQFQSAYDLATTGDLDMETLGALGIDYEPQPRAQFQPR
jgi:peptidoglycan hydrolase-like protein with peptidoglycan-binding domain